MQCMAYGISDTSMPTVHFVGVYVNSHSTFQVANVPKDRPAYNTEHYAPSYYGLLVIPGAHKGKEHATAFHVNTN